MRGVIRSVAMVCVLAFSVSVLAGTREVPRGGEIVKRIIKKIRALGDGLTVPGV